MENGELKMENERNVSPVSAHAFNNEKPPCKSRGWFQSVDKVNLSFYLSCGSTHKIEFAQQIHNSQGVAQATPLCRYAAIHLVYLGNYTRDEKLCP